MKFLNTIKLCLAVNVDVTPKVAWNDVMRTKTGTQFQRSLLGSEPSGARAGGGAAGGAPARPNATPLGNRRNAECWLCKTVWSLPLCLKVVQRVLSVWITRVLYRHQAHGSILCGHERSQRVNCVTEILRGAGGVRIHIIHMCVCVCVCVYIYIYIYVYIPNPVPCCIMRTPWNNMLHCVPGSKV
jgi:hypothetical protein